MALNQTGPNTHEYSSKTIKFLDSPDKTATAQGVVSPLILGNTSTPRSLSTSHFKYEWAAAIDGEENEDWHLVSCQSKENEPDISTFAGNIDRELGVFSIFLCAIYNKPYSLEGPADLEDLVKMADYYCALPAVSRTLDAAMLRSQMLAYDLIELPCTYLALATTVRSALLFRESLIYAVGPYSSPGYHLIECHKLRKIARHAWAEVGAKVAEFTVRMLSQIYSDRRMGSTTTSESLLMELEAASSTLASRVNLPMLIRQLGEPKNGLHDQMREAFYSLLDDKRVLTLTEPVESLCDYFLCAEIADEDLPWDINELDW
ncbi:hypothetical protein MBM_03489 [Drepanopeziza brunnea f. sp. 'multigermtubi' MB_m1]|uniref:Uncharacterized protein n=1 Tax=Marssonina brunnea f. sp. multigermtubi (strain MB_m1) TaxID=1072389 RepID=K1WZS5_MARBU|nr:uncharacterized protein MBM_03489 [Drepanopeziza brunnea f. sp. 'multigermtubi' MB_m1]EKD18496.1 hypothetical protein MBM_03489 [Drepanopeziza brunnea f. sp. 'multigermtubi' MB_m1]